MLHFIDELLRRQMVNEIPGLTVNDVRFFPPNEDWRQHVGLGDRAMVNACLVDLRENRILRRNEAVRSVSGIEASSRAAPLRVDCHYLFSVQAPGAVGQAVEPTLEEHALLGEVIAAFSQAVPLSFERVFQAVGLPVGLPPDVADDDLPFELLPAAGWPKLEEFWGTMGNGAVHKPAIYLVITAPFLKTVLPAGPLVTQLRVGSLPGEAAVAETIYSIAGRVGDSAAPLPDGEPGPLPAAWVELLTLTGRRIALHRSDDEGRFIFERLPAGAYRIRATVEVQGSRNLDIVLPSDQLLHEVTF